MAIIIAGLTSPEIPLNMCELCRVEVSVSRISNFSNFKIALRARPPVSPAQHPLLYYQHPSNLERQSREVHGLEGI